MIEIAQKKAEAQGIKNIEFQVEDAYNSRFSNDTFNCCVVANALHAVKDPDRVMSELKRVLKPGGILICPTFCHGQNSLSRLASRAAHLFGFRVHTRFSIDSFEQFVKQSGFGVVDVRAFKGIWPLVYLVAGKHTGSQLR